MMKTLAWVGPWAGLNLNQLHIQLESSGWPSDTQFGLSWKHVWGWECCLASAIEQWQQSARPHQNTIGCTWIIHVNMLWLIFRGLFIIDDKGILRQITMNDLPVGRSVDETLRLVQAFQFNDKHGEGTQAVWSKNCVPPFNQYSTLQSNFVSQILSLPYYPPLPCVQKMSMLRFWIPHKPNTVDGNAYHMSGEEQDHTPILPELSWKCKHGNQYTGCGTDGQFHILCIDYHTCISIWFRMKRDWEKPFCSSIGLKQFKTEKHGKWKTWRQSLIAFGIHPITVHHTLLWVMLAFPMAKPDYILFSLLAG